AVWVLNMGLSRPCTILDCRKRVDQSFGSVHPSGQEVWSSGRIRSVKQSPLPPRFDHGLLWGTDADDERALPVCNWRGRGAFQPVGAQRPQRVVESKQGPGVMYLTS